MKKRNDRKLKKAAILLSIILAISMIACLPMGAAVAFADETGQSDSTVLKNKSGQEIVIDVEEEISAEEATTLQDGDTPLAAPGSSSSLTTIEDEDTPLAGFSKVNMSGDKNDIHLFWMILLLAAAIAYVVYFSRYQNRIFDLRRRIAEAESELRRGGK